MSDSTNYGGVLVQGMRLERLMQVLSDGTFDFDTLVVGGATIFVNDTYAVVSKDDQTIGTGSNTLITWDYEEDDGGNFDLANERYVVPADGIYLIMLQCVWESDGTGYRRATIAINEGSGTDSFARSQENANATGEHIHQAHLTVRLDAGDYIYGYVRQDSGGDLTLEGGTIDGVRRNTYMTIVRIGP